jgi:hypothetical protein
MPKVRTTLILIAAVAAATLTAGQTAFAKSERVVGFIYDDNGAVYRVQDKNGANSRCGPSKAHRIHADFPSFKVCLYDESAHGPLQSDRTPFLADCGN